MEKPLIIINKKLLIYSLNLQPEPIIHLTTTHRLGCKTFNFIKLMKHIVQQKTL